jgi:hypothetical protein
MMRLNVEHNKEEFRIASNIKKYNQNISWFYVLIENCEELLLLPIFAHNIMKIAF